jgi:signal transduction histidine kinase
MKSAWIVAAGFMLLYLLLTWWLISVDAFEWFHEYSRDHEDWELDEFAAATLSAILVALVALSLYTGANLRALRREVLLRRQFEREAAATRHLQALGTLAGGLAHSANNFVQPIITLARLSRDEVPKDSELRENLNRILRSANAAAELFREVLKFSHPERQAVDQPGAQSNLQQNFDMIEPIVRMTLPRNIELTLDTEVDCEISMDTTRFADAMLALLKNAADSIGDANGRIAVTAFRESEGVAVIRIEDDGGGMTETEISRAFEPFYTTKAVDKGTGLGLSIVRSLVEAAGGSISLESRRGNGTTVVLLLPATCSQQNSDEG